jgi:outer membrane protein OmpU
MNKFKKIGLSALAGSLVATSAYAGEVTVAGSAGMFLEHINGGAANSGKSFSMSNQLTFTGGGELDNGLNVSISFVIDQGDDTTTSVGSGTLTFGGGAPFDSHSVTVSSDSLGSLTMTGEGMDSASGAVDGTVSGNIWDAFQASADEPQAAPGAAGGLNYTLPSLMDDLTVKASYSPKGSNADSSTAWSVAYAGVDGLSLTFARGEDNATAGSEADHEVMKATYAYGPVTVGYMESDYNDAVASGDQNTTAYNVAYTVSDELSLSYGSEELTFGAASATNVAAEFERVKVTYVSGGMTLTASQASGDNVSYTTATTEDREVWALGASFAF